MPKRDIVKRIDLSTELVGSGGGSGSGGAADTVDGFHASAIPTPGLLLPLDSSGQFPASVIAGVSALGGLSDVAIDTPVDNELLAYDTTAGEWINQTAAEAGLQATLTTGNLTASTPIVLDETRQVIGGAAVISHLTTAGNIHLPTGGSANQLLKNSGVSGTTAWGTVTENAGALSKITTISANTNTGTPVAPPSGTIIHVTGADNTAPLIVMDGFGTAAIPFLYFQRAEGTLAAPTPTIAGLMGGLRFFGYGASGYSATSRVRLSVVSEETWTDSKQGAYLQISATTIGTVSTPVVAKFYGTGLSTALPITSTLAIGTAPLAVTSTTLCSNLNADMVDGVQESALLLAAGTRTGASSQAQVFTLGIVGPSWKPAADGTTALLIQDSAGTTNLVTLDTTNKTVGFGTTAPTVGTGTLNITNTIASTAAGTFRFVNHVSSIAPASNPVDVQEYHGYSLVLQTAADAAAYYATSVLRSFNIVVSHRGSGLLPAAFGAYGDVRSTGGGTITTAAGLSGQVRATGASSVITNGYGVYVQPPVVNTGGAISFLTGIYVASQTAGASVNWALYTNAGLNRLGDQLAVVGSADRVQLSVTGYSTQTANVADLIRNDAYYNTVNTVLRLVANTTGTPTAGLGARLLFGIESSTTVSKNAAAIEASAINVTDADSTNRLAFYAYDSAGQREGFRIDSDKTAARISFFGGTAVVKQSHIADANAAYAAGNLDTEAEIIAAINAANGKLNSLLAAIEAYGLLATS
jgi:hypothetical protein